MRFVKKIICLLLAMFMVAGLFSSIQVDAKEISISTPKIKVKLVNKKTGAKITIGKTKDADGFEISVSGIPVVSEYNYAYFKYKDSKGDIYLSEDPHLSTSIEKNGKVKRNITLKNLQPGTYTVKVRSWNNKKYGTKIYSEWSQEKSWTIKDTSTNNGYSTSYDFSKVKKGDVVKFGVYEQDLNYTNGKEAIEWVVLKKTKNSILLLSKYGIDRLPYHKDYGNVTWETCTLRKWLNNDFIKSAFNKTEQDMIKTTTVENYDNVIYKTAGGKDTKDKVFLLSQFEMINTDFGFSENYDKSDVNRRCALAWYKNKDGGEYATADGKYTCWYWLRSPGEGGYYSCIVSRIGYVDSMGRDNGNVGVYDGVQDCGAGVRPAMWINIKS